MFVSNKEQLKIEITAVQSDAVILLQGISIIMY